MTDIDEAMRMLREGQTVDLSGDDVEEVSPHWLTCTHRGEGYELVREAEQVAIFHDHNHHRMHISVRDSNGEQTWYSCHTTPCIIYETMTEENIMAVVNDQLKFLRTLRE